MWEVVHCHNALCLNDAYAILTFQVVYPRYWCMCVYVFIFGMNMLEFFVSFDTFCRKRFHSHFVSTMFTENKLQNIGPVNLVHWNHLIHLHNQLNLCARREQFGSLSHFKLTSGKWPTFDQKSLVTSLNQHKKWNYVNNTLSRTLSIRFGALYVTNYGHGCHSIQSKTIDSAVDGSIEAIFELNRSIWSTYARK